MFEGRDNLIGIVLLIACGISAGTMLGYIDAREVARFDGPDWQRYLIIGGGLALILATILVGRGGQPGNDVRSKRRRWWRRDKDDISGDNRL